MNSLDPELVLKPIASQYSARPSNAPTNQDSMFGDDQYQTVEDFDPEISSQITVISPPALPTPKPLPCRLGEIISDDAYCHNGAMTSSPPITTENYVSSGSHGPNTSIDIISSPSRKPPFFQRFKALLFPGHEYSHSATHLGDDVEASYVPNYRLTPNISGICMPFAILLQIPGLTEHWYIRTMDNQTVEMRKNPAILDVGIAISMACALIANICLIVRFLEKYVSTMTLVAIGFLTIQDVINIVAVTMFGVEHRFNDGFVYGQSFWLTVCSTIASVFANGTLIYDLVTTPNFSKSGSGLTRKQRALVIICMLFLCWIALGALIHSFILNLTFIDGLYFTVVSIETIGFGDIHPDTTLSRIFTPLYVSIAIITLGLSLATCRETVIEFLELQYRMRMRVIRERVMESRIHLSTGRAISRAIEKQLREAGLRVYVPVPRDGLRGRSGTEKMQLNIAALSMDRRQAALREAFGAPTEFGNMAEGGGHRVGWSTLGNEVLKSHVDISTPNLNAYASSDYEGEVDLDREARKVFAVQLLVAWTLFLTFWMSGSAIFTRTEGWPFGISMYFCFVTFSTIGYGDYAPASPAGRSIFVVWALLGVATMTILISVISEAFSSRYRDALHSMPFKKVIKAYRKRSSSNLRKDNMSFSMSKESHRGESITGVSHAPSSLVYSHGHHAPSIHIPNHAEMKPTNTFANPEEISDGHVRFKIHSTISRAKALLEQLSFFSDGGHSMRKSGKVPVGVRSLLEDLATEEKLDKRLRTEILTDGDARRDLYFVSLYKTLGEVIEAAENMQHR